MSEEILEWLNIKLSVLILVNMSFITSAMFKQQETHYIPILSWLHFHLPFCLYSNKLQMDV